ncbi:MAG: hypothetical protein WCQ95_09260 [Bacteroidota bacterium]
MSEEINKKSDSDKLTSLLPYVGPLLILFGVIRLIVFYRNFGITIINYLDITEIITSFFDILIITILAILNSMFQQFLFVDKKNYEANKNLWQKLISENNSKAFLSLCFQYYKRQIIITFILVLSCVSLCIFGKNINWVLILYLISFALFLLVVNFITIFIDRIHFEFKSPLYKKRRAYFVFYFLVLIIIICGFASWQAYDVKKMKSNIGITVTLDNDTILISNSSQYYIGKTKEYLFYYHEDLKVTDVIPMTRVKEINFPDNGSIK